MTKPLERLLIVGGGSAYAPGLFSALLHHRKRHALKEVRLMDIDAENVEIVGRLCTRMAEAAGAGIAVKWGTRLEDLLPGADVVLNSSRPGGLECRHIDESLPLELGVPGQETVGPGGFFFALRSVPEALKLATLMEKHAPHAVLLNYTNPTNIVTQVLSARSKLRVIGLCDQSDEDLQALAEALGKAEAPYTFQCKGLNHGTWYSGIRIDGNELTHPPTGLSAPAEMDADHQLRFELSQKLCEKYFHESGQVFWPNSYLTYYYFPERFVELLKKTGSRAAQILPKMPGYYRHFREEAAKDKPELRHHRGTHGFGDMAVEALIALQSEAEMVVNLPAPDAARGVSRGTVHESRVDLGPDGAKFGNPAPAPSNFSALLARLEEYQLAAAEAAATLDSRLFETALRANPLVSDRAVAARLLERAKAAYDGRIEALS